jgi:hypothetical protein
VQSSNLLQLRETVGEDARTSEKFAFLEIQYPCHNAVKKHLLNIQQVVLLRPNSSRSHCADFCHFLPEKCQRANPAIELTHPRCYRKGRSEPVLSRKPVDRGVAMLIIKESK